MVRAFVKSVEYMSPRKIGALAVQRVRTLQEYILNWDSLDAKISSELLNIFYPNTPFTRWSGHCQRRSDCNFSLPTPDWKYVNFQGVWDTSQGSDWFVWRSDALTFVVSEETVEFNHL